MGFLIHNSQRWIGMPYTPNPMKFLNDVWAQ